MLLNNFYHLAPHSVLEDRNRTVMENDLREFCLKWNNHHNTLISVLDSLLMKERLVDVTLAAEGQFINVHRIVLFACSQYFEELLSQLPDKQAVIFLKDVKFADLKALVDVKLCNII